MCDPRLSDYWVLEYVIENVLTCHLSSAVIIPNIYIYIYIENSRNKSIVPWLETLINKDFDSFLGQLEDSQITKVFSHEFRLTFWLTMKSPVRFSIFGTARKPIKWKEPISIFFHRSSALSLYSLSKCILVLLALLLPRKWLSLLPVLPLLPLMHKNAKMMWFSLPSPSKQAVSDQICLPVTLH